jgi:hypothetical protein
VLIAWTWSQLAHEFGICTAGLVAVVCVGYLTRKGWIVLKQQRRFSLLDLLVAVTLAGALAGLIKGFAGDDKHGMPYRLDDEWDVLHNSEDSKQREIN